MIRTRAILLAAAAFACVAAAPDTLSVADHVAAAEKLAGEDLRTPLFLCRADSGTVVRNAIDNDAGKWIEPVRLFNRLSFVGNRFVGSYVLETSDGLILFDAGAGEAEVRDHLVPGLRKLGLDPARIRYAVVTHGHWDHFGGARWLQETYGTRIALSAADWDLIGHGPADLPELGGKQPPKRDLVIADGQRLTLGDTSITLYVTPGHTPGTLSAIVPVRQGKTTHIFSLLGSTAFPATVEPTDRAGGLAAYDRSILRFAQISRKAGAVGLLNTHIFADGGYERLEAARSAGSGAPLLVGKAAVARYYGLFDHCLKAAILRHQPATQP